jgi:hypothetical protein
VLEKLAAGDSGGGDHAARWEAELVDVANKVMIADQVDLGDMRRQRESVDKVRRWISIGLEAAAAADVEAGAVLIKERTLEHFFRLAAMLFDALGSAVVELEKAEQASSGVLISGEFSDAYLALTEPEPQIPEHTRFSSRRHLFTLAEYRFAWQLVWSMERYLRQQTRPASAVVAVAPVAAPAAGVAVPEA